MAKVQSGSKLGGMSSSRYSPGRITVVGLKSVTHKTGCEGRREPGSWYLIRDYERVSRSIE